MTDKQLKLFLEVMSHQYAMNMAGFSSLAGILIAGQKQALKGAALSDEEIHEAKREGSDTIAQAYHTAIAARAYSTLTKDKDPNMQ